MFGRWLGVRSDTEITTAVADIRKLDSWIAHQTLQLQSVTPEARGEIVHDIAVSKQRRDELTDRLVALRNRPEEDRGGRPILLPDSTGGPPNRVQFTRTRAHDLVAELIKIDRPEFLRAIQE